MTEALLAGAARRNLFDNRHRWAILIDLRRLHRRFRRLQQAFDADTLHAAAIKAHPLVAVLQELVDAGAGLEAASMGELEIARLAGAPPERMVFDSPAKTDRDIDEVLDAGIVVNADNLDEVERIARRNLPDDASLGIRVNPVVGAGDIDATSVATESSKFGVSLTRNRRALIDAFRRHPWLRRLHVHTGSQGLGLSRLVEGVRRCVDVADDIDKAAPSRRIDAIDIGGGLPVAYRPHRQAPTIEDYADALRREVPNLFDRRRQVITEFGRWLFAPCAIAVSRVEYVKPSATGPIAIIHFGADLLLRTAYRPDDWYHRVTIHNADGTARSGDDTDVTIAGPLCFSGDIVARNRRLPRPSPDDLVAVHDVGAYTFSMWSKYCSRSLPPMYGVVEDHSKLQFKTLHHGESPSQTAAFWTN